MIKEKAKRKQRKHDREISGSPVRERVGSVDTNLGGDRIPSVLQRRSNPKTINSPVHPGKGPRESELPSKRSRNLVTLNSFTSETSAAHNPMVHRHVGPTRMTNMPTSPTRMSPMSARLDSSNLANRNKPLSPASGINTDLEGMIAANSKRRRQDPDKLKNEKVKAEAKAANNRLCSMAQRGDGFSRPTLELHLTGVQ